MYGMYGELVPVGGGDNIPLLKKELIVGRKEDCDIVLRFANVSSRHCRLLVSSGYWYVQDMKSTNGVKVNGLRVDDRRVDPGAKLTIAHHDYRIEYDPVELGAFGAPPPDVLDTQIFSKSLLERAGLQGKVRGEQDADMLKSAKKPQHQAQDGIERRDYSEYSVDDISYE